MADSRFRIGLLLFLLAGKALAGGPAPGSAVRTTWDGLLPGRAAIQAKARLITDNSEAWYTRWWMVSQARQTIDCTYYSFYDDIFGKSFLGLLAWKARQGVQVRLMVDSRGSEDMSRRVWRQGFLQALLESGHAEVKVYNPVTPQLARVFSDGLGWMASNHDKLLIIDGRLAITGGRNIAKGYYADPSDFARCWRDSDVLMSLPEVAAAATRAFEDEFTRLETYRVVEAWLIGTEDEAKEIEVARRVMERWLTGRGLAADQGGEIGPMLSGLVLEVAQYRKLSGFAGALQDPLSGCHTVRLKILDKHSRVGEQDEIRDNLVALMDAAEHEIFLQNPYVVPTKPFVEALYRAGRRGVNVTIHTNSCSSTDNLLTQAFLVRDWKRMLRDVPGLRIFAYDGPRKLHSKVFVFDDQVAVVGTYNLDAMSAEINSEVVAAVQDGDFARRTRLRIEEDMKASTEYKMHVDEHGVMVTDVGPEQKLEGMAARLMPLLTRLGFLRSIL